MKYTVPDYYNQFQCIAGECPATCCAGWQIVIDEKTLNRYRNCKTTLGNRLRNSIDWKSGTFLQYDRRCAFLDENNLCDLYTEAGPDMLCRTCRRYPRHVEEFENEREISLSLSCPVAARLIMGRSEKVIFLSKEDLREEKEDENFDFFLYSALQDSRSLMIQILQDREKGIGFRMAKILGLAHDIQNRIDARRIFDIENLLERYGRAGADSKLKNRLQGYVNTERAAKIKKEMRMLLEELEVLDPEWTAQRNEWDKILDEVSEKTDSEAESGTDTFAAVASQKELECEQLMVYFIYTYFCGAVYDGDALSKVKMAIVSTLLIQELEFAEQLSAGRVLTLEERTKVAWRYSRELEHSDLNLNHMEKMMKEREMVSLDNLLTVCCSYCF
ncbi:MAG: flagellin lysine-N-methylase [Lachnospiraceae bacterium]|nr:flagellin lysine-N-methylase [Lachnospiraceae bacterium]